MLQFNTISSAGASIQSLKENKIKSGCPRSAEINFGPDQIRSSTVGGDQIWLPAAAPEQIRSSVDSREQQQYEKRRRFEITDS
ncbi:unnamed protein product [Sphagnum balticum]